MHGLLLPAQLPFGQGAVSIYNSDLLLEVKAHVDRIDMIVRIAREAIEGEGPPEDAHEALYIIHNLARGDSTSKEAEGYWSDWLCK